MKKILSCAGGGIRGAATAEFLRLLEADLGQPLVNVFDLFAGTSTGAIVSLGIGGAGLSAASMAELYNPENATVIMPIANPSDSLVKRLWYQVLNPKFDGTGKRKKLDEFFKNLKMSESRKEVLAVTYDVEKKHVAVLKKSNAANLSLVEVVDASSAAPTYFPAVQISDGRWLVDGGVCAGNPAMCAYAEAKRLWPSEDVKILSVGTGTRDKKVNGAETKGYGYLGWALSYDLISTLMDETVTDYLCQYVVGEGRYLNVDSDLGKANDAMDDVQPENIRALKELGGAWYQQFGERAIKFIKE